MVFFNGYPTNLTALQAGAASHDGVQPGSNLTALQADAASHDGVQPG
jgi:hypothetical protein